MDYTLNNFNKVTFVCYLPLTKFCEPSFRTGGESGKDIATDVGKISLIQQSSARTRGFHHHRLPVLIGLASFRVSLQRDRAFYFLDLPRSKPLLFHLNPRRMCT